MSVERNLLISILKLTKEGPVLIENVNKEARIPSTVSLELLEKLQNEDLLYLNNGIIEVESSSRIKLAVKAVSQGAVIEHISDLLCWQEFEEIAAIALKNNGYIVKNNVRFKHGTKRWEIDVVGCKKPLVVCIDCKHWQHAISSSALKRIVDLQSQRTHALADSLPNLKLKFECDQMGKSQVYPNRAVAYPQRLQILRQRAGGPCSPASRFHMSTASLYRGIKIFSKTFKTLKT